MKNKLSVLLAVLLTATMLLTACAPQATVAPTEAPKPTDAPAATAVPTEAPKPTDVPTVAPTAEPTALPGTDWESVDPTGQKISFWHNHTKAREEFLKSIVDEFNKTNEYKIEVTAEYQGAYNEIFNKILPVLNTTDAPDLVVAYQNNAATYQLSDAVVDLNPLVNSAKYGLSAEDQKDFFPGFFAQDVFPNFGNARLGLAPNRSEEVLIYNMDYLKELGYTEAPTTPDQLKEMACKASKTPFSKATGKGTPIGYEIDLADASSLATWVFAFGGNIYDSKTSLFTYNSDAAVQAMTWLQGMFKEGCAVRVTEKYGNQTDFGNGTALFTTGSSSGLPFYQSAVDGGAKFAWSVAAPSHTTPDPVTNIYGASVSVMKTTPERDLAAWIFLKYYTSKEVQAKWAEVSGYFPVRASVADGMTEYMAKNPNYKIGFDLLKYGIFEPPVPGYDFVREKVVAAFAAIADGAEVKATLDTLNTDANTILADQMSQMKK